MRAGDNSVSGTYRFARVDGDCQDGPLVDEALELPRSEIRQAAETRIILLATSHASIPAAAAWIAGWPGLSDECARPSRACLKRIG